MPRGVVAQKVDIYGRPDEKWVHVKLDESRLGRGVDRDGDHASVWLTCEEARTILATVVPRHTR